MSSRSQIWLFTQKHSNFKLNIIGDVNLLSGLIFKAVKSVTFMIGVGISKHHTLWWNQYREGLDYAFTSPLNKNLMVVLVEH